MGSRYASGPMAGGELASCAETTDHGGLRGSPKTTGLPGVAPSGILDGSSGQVTFVSSPCPYRHVGSTGWVNRRKIRIREMKAAQAGRPSVCLGSTVQQIKGYDRGYFGTMVAWFWANLLPTPASRSQRQCASFIERELRGILGRVRWRSAECSYPLRVADATASTSTARGCSRSRYSATYPVAREISSSRTPRSAGLPMRGDIRGSRRLHVSSRTKTLGTASWLRA